MLDNFLIPYPKTINKLLEGQYSIPIMQRDYVWKDRHVKDLLEDIQNSIEDLESDDQYYFIGSMVSSLTSLDGEKGDREYIIDGQQRLITLTLVLSAVRDIFRFRKYFSNSSEDIDQDVIDMYDSYIFFKHKGKVYDSYQKRNVVRVSSLNRVELQNREDNDFFLHNIDNNYIFNTLKELTVQKLKSIDGDINETIFEIFKDELLKINIEKLISSLKKICSYVDYEEESIKEDFTEEVRKFEEIIALLKNAIDYKEQKYKDIIITTKDFKDIIKCALVDLLCEINKKLKDFSFNDHELAVLFKPLKLNKKELREFLTRQITQMLLVDQDKINEIITEHKINIPREYYHEYKKLQLIKQGVLSYSTLSYLDKSLLLSIEELENELILTKQSEMSATQRNIFEAKNFAYKKIIAMETLEVMEFADQLLQKVAVVKLTTNDFSSAYRIFETINERGLGLSPEDLLKNLVLKNITDIESRQRISTTWDGFKNTFLNKEEGKYIVSIPTFLKHFIMSKEKYISKNDIFNYFNDNYGKKDQYEIENLVSELLEHAKAYIDIIKDEKSLLNKLNFKQGYIVQLAMYNLSKNTKEKISRYLQNVAFVFYITNSRTNELERKFVEIAKIIRKMENEGESEVLITEVINLLQRLYRDKKDVFIEGLQKFNYNEKMPKHIAIVKYFLGTISIAIDGNDFQNYSIEHILNAKRGDKYLSKEYKEVSQRLGNLTLLLGNDNSALCNIENFIDKKDVYKKCACTLTRSLVEEIPFSKNTKQKLAWEKYTFDVPTVFEAKQIKERTTALSNIWKFLFF